MIRVALAAAAVAALTQCAAPSAPPIEATPTPRTPPPAITSPPAGEPPRRESLPATVHPVTAAELGATWRPGCPLGPERLRRVDLDHLGFDAENHRGSLVVHEDLVAETIEIFAQLRAMDFPIERMQTADHYPGADDELSMRDNNTSAFNCRDIPGTGRWSEHAYGRAIDINPQLNPYIDARGGFQPANAGLYVDRDRIDPGLLHDGDPAVLAFTDRGWRWGGRWRSPIDYQHFERP